MGISGLTCGADLNRSRLAFLVVPPRGCEYYSFLLILLNQGTLLFTFVLFVDAKSIIFLKFCLSIHSHIFSAITSLYMKLAHFAFSDYANFSPLYVAPLDAYLLTFEYFCISSAS